MLYILSFIHSYFFTFKLKWNIMHYYKVLIEARYCAIFIRTLFANSTETGSIHGSSGDIKRDGHLVNAAGLAEA